MFDDLMDFVTEDFNPMSNKGTQGTLALIAISVFSPVINWDIRRQKRLDDRMKRGGK